MNLSTGKSALRVPPLPSPPNKKGPFCSMISSCSDRPLSQEGSVTLKTSSLCVQNANQLLRVCVCLCVCVCGDSVVQEVWDQAVRLFYLDVLVGEPVKRCARSTGLQALGIFYIRASFDLVSFLQLCSSWGLLQVSSLPPSSGGKEGSWREAATLGQLLPGVFLLAWKLVAVHPEQIPRPSAVRDRGA